MRRQLQHSVELENDTEFVQTPQDIARKIQNKFGNRRNLQSFDTGNNNIHDMLEQRTNMAIHSYQNTRPRQNNNNNNNDTYMSPPYRTTHHQYDHLHLQIIIHLNKHVLTVTFDNVYLREQQHQTQIIYDFHMRLHPAQTTENLFSISLQMNRLRPKRSWKQFGSKTRIQKHSITLME